MFISHQSKNHNNFTNAKRGKVIKGKFGWDHVIGVCWLTSTNKRDRLVWQISTQLLWILLAVAITGVSAAITLTYLYKHKVRAIIHILFTFSLSN